MNKKLLSIWKNFLAPLTLFAVTTSMLLMVFVPANAQDLSDTIRGIGDTSKLPSYETTGHSNASIESGASGITSAILYVVDFVKYAMGTVAVVTIIISGVKLVTAGGKGMEEESSKAKDHIKFALIGLIVIIVSDQFVKTVFFGEQGEIFGSKSTLQEAAKAGSKQIRGIYSVMAYFSGALAVLYIVIAGFKYITSAGNEENMEKAKKQITYAVIGLILIGIAEFAVKDVLFPEQGSKLTDVEKAKTLIINLTNFISGFLTTVAAVMYIYAGYIYVTAMGNEEATGKAKKIMLGATIGLLLAMAAFGIVNTTVKLESQIGTPGPGSNTPGTSATSGSI